MGISPTGFMAMQGVGAATSAVGAFTSANASKISLQSQAGAADAQANIVEIQGRMAANNAEASARSAELNASNQSRTALMNADANKQNSELNARLAEESAQSAILTGERRQQNLDLVAGATKSTQRAGLAAGGIDLGSQSALSILTSTDVMHESDRNTIAANAIREAYGHRVSETNFTNQARMAEAVGESTSITSLAAGKTSALIDRAGGDVAQRSAKMNAIGLRTTANNARTTASGINPFVAAGTSLLGSASNAMLSYSAANKSGLFEDKPTPNAKTTPNNLTMTYGMPYVMTPGAI